MICTLPEPSDRPASTVMPQLVPGRPVFRLPADELVVADVGGDPIFVSMIPRPVGITAAFLIRIPPSLPWHRTMVQTSCSGVVTQRRPDLDDLRTQLRP
jgi:hypothetical protein